MCFISYRVDFNGLSGSVYSGSGYAHGIYEMGMTDPRDQLDAATTVDEIADILSDALRLIIAGSEQHRSDERIRCFRLDVKAARDFYELLGLKADCKRVVGNDVDTTGVAHQLTYDFPSRTSTFSEAHLSDGNVTFRGDPFVNDEGAEYNPFERYVS